MSNISQQKSLEEQYTLKSISAFKEADEYLSKKIKETINVVSFQVACVFNTPLPDHEKKEVLSDLWDFIPTNLAMNQVFFNIVTDFIFEKAKEIEKNKTNKINKSTNNKSDDNNKNTEVNNNLKLEYSIDESIEKMHYYLDIIKKDIILIEESLLDIIWMRDVLCPQILNQAKRQLFDIKRWLEKNVVEINLAITSITFLVIWIEQEKWKINLTDSQKISIYNDDGNFISDEPINRIKELLFEFQKQTEDYENHINNIIELKMLKEESEEKLRIDNLDDIRETDIMLEIISLFEDTKAISIINSTQYILGTIKDIVESDIPHNDKIKKFEKPLDFFELDIFEWNQDALILLNKLISVRIEDYIISSDRDITMSITIPRSCHLEVMKQLNIIVNLVLWEKKDDEVKKTIIKRKCNLFIWELNKILLDLYTLISEDWNYVFFKNTKIKSILKKLKIEEWLHEYFLDIVGLYYRDKRSTFNIESEKRKRPLKILEEAYEELEDVLKDFPLSQLKIAEKFLKFVQINLPKQIHFDIIDNISAENTKVSWNLWVRWLIQKMHNSSTRTWSGTMPYDTMFKTSEDRIKKNSQPQIMWAQKTKEQLEEKRINEVMQHFFSWFALQKECQNKLRPFLKCLYKYETQRALKNYNMVGDVFKKVKDMN